MQNFKTFLIASVVLAFIYMTITALQPPKRVSLINPNNIIINEIDLIDSKANITENENDHETEEIAEILTDFGDITDDLNEENIGFLSGEIVKGSADGGKISLKDGKIDGVNFQELYCRARAFSKGEFMPKTRSENFYHFKSAEFELIRSKSGLEFRDIIIRSDYFIFSMDTIRENQRAKAYLSMTKLFKNRCGVDSGYLDVVLPLWCQMKDNQISCALDLKELIFMLSSVEAKTTKEERKEEIKKFKDEIVEQRDEFIKSNKESDLKSLRIEFKKRKKEKQPIEEHDLRELFVP